MDCRLKIKKLENKKIIIVFIQIPGYAGIKTEIDSAKTNN